MTISVLAPVSGAVVGLSDVPDPVFSAALVGPGCAVDPARHGVLTAVAPFAGEVVKLHPHAYVVKGEGEAGVLVHLGIDTVQLNGDGFELLVAEGDTVEAGAPIVTWNPTEIEAGGRSPIVPVIALDAGADDLRNHRDSGDVAAGDQLFEWLR